MNSTYTERFIKYKNVCLDVIHKHNDFSCAKSFIDTGDSIYRLGAFAHTIVIENTRRVSKLCGKSKNSQLQVTEKRRVIEV